MLTKERVERAERALGFLATARRGVDDLYEDARPLEDPRSVELRTLCNDLAAIERRLQAVYS